MKYLFLILSTILTLSSCKEEEPLIQQSSLTTIEGRYTLVNTDQPIAGVYVYIYSGVFPFQSEVLDWCYTDSNGYYKLTFDNKQRNALFNDNLDGLPYITSRHKRGISQDLAFLPDGKIHIRDFEMIPPAWVNVRMIDKGNFSGYNEIGVGSEHFTGGGWNIYGPKDSTIMVKVYGNMPDTISFGYWEMDGTTNWKDQLKKSLKFPVFVPPFQVQDLTIEY